MKLKAKILTIVLVLATLISIIGVFAIPASAAASDWKIRGDFNGWGETAPSKTSGNFAMYEVSLAANKSYAFKIYNGSWYGNSGTITNTTGNDWWKFDSDANCTLKTTVAGTYVFVINTSTTSVAVYSPKTKVVGASGLCGSNWDTADSNNAMLFVNGVFTKTYTNVPKGTYEYKVSLVDDWSSSFGNNGGSNNASVTVGSDNCTVTIKFDVTTRKPSAVVVDTHTDSNTDGDHNCDTCGKENVTSCSGGDATCMIKAVCEDCNQSYGDLAAHSWSTTEWSHDVDGHWRACTIDGCTAISKDGTDAGLNQKAEHTWDGNSCACGEPKPACTHDYSITYEWAVDYSSCTATKTCTKSCGMEPIEETTTNISVVNTATCTAGGTKTYTATFSAEHGIAADTEEIASEALGHSFGATTEANAATCLAAGNDAYKQCTVCNLYFAGAADENSTEGKADTTSFVIAKKAHTLNSRYECSECENRIVYVKNTGWANVNCYTWSTVGDLVGWPGAAMTDEGDGLWSYLIPISKNCTKVIFNNGSVQTGDLDLPTNCKVVYNKSADGWETAGHIFDLEVMTQDTLKDEATCNSYAIYYKSCSCGAVSNSDEYTFEYIEGGYSTNHVAPIGTACGSDFVCTICLNPIKGNHANVVTDAAVDPTCTETGLTEGSHCAACDTVIVAQEVVDALGHTKGADATCTTNQICTVCEVELKAALGHNFVNGNCDRCDCIKVFFKPGSDWAADNAWFAVYHFSVGNAWEKMTLENGVYTAIVPEGDTIIFCRMNPAFDVLGWDDGDDRVWNQTVDIAPGNNCFIIDNPWDSSKEYKATVKADAHEVTTWSPINETTHSGACTVCGETVVGDHSYTGDWQIGADNHWKDCDSCGYDGHAGEHNYTGDVQKDGTYHWQTCSCGDTNKVEHNYNKTVANETYKATDATCTSPASYYSSCACGAKGTSTFTSGVIADHVFVTHDAVAATCQATGNAVYYTCKNCSNYFTSNADPKTSGVSFESFKGLEDYYFPKLDHSYTGSIKDDGNGKHSFKCVNGCNEYGNATNHVYDQTVANDTYKVSDATCTAQAVYNKSCACGAEGTEPFSAGEKDPTNHSGEQVNGGTADVHTKWSCCGVTVSSNHEFGNWAPVVDTNTHKRTCSCGHSETAEHSFANYVYNENATCTEDGTETSTCVCGATDTRTKVGSKLGHEFDNYVAYKAPTCTEKGNQAYKQCTRCNIYFLSEAGNYTEGGVLGSALNTFDIAASGHTFDEIGYDAPTCTEAGNEAHKKCTVCNLYFDTEATEDATDGSENNNEYIINAFGHKDDNKDHVCDNNCGVAQGDHVDADKDHACDYGCSVAIGDHVDTNKDHACDYGCSEAIGEHKDSATDDNHVCDYGCDEVLEECSDVTGDGNHNCDVCGTADVTGHSYDNPTCTESSTCTECGATSGEPMGHDFSEGIECKNGCGSKAVASIDGKYYLTLQQAFDAVENGETIVLARDFELSATAVAPAVKFTIDLNGKTVTSADDYVLNSYNQSIICVTRGTDLTINDSIGDGCLDASELLIAINLTRYGDSDTGECAKLTVNAGKYLGGYYAIAGNGSRDNTYIEINDGQFIGDISAIYHPQEGTLVITGGSFVGNGAGGYGGDAIGFLSGSLEISGGTFEGKALAAVSIENIGGTSGYQEIGTVSITGGTFISAEGYDSIISADEGGGRKISFISGGTFNTDLDLALLVDGLALKQGGESYTVVNAVAKIEGTGYGYASLADAVAAAQANDVIILLANDTVANTLNIGKSLTINTGAFAITSKADVAFNITAASVSFKLVGNVIMADPAMAQNARSGGMAVAQIVLTMDDVADVTAILDAEFELGAGDVIYSGPVDNISLSVRAAYAGALNKKGYVTKDSTTPGMVDVTAKSLYYIGDDGYWYFDDVKTGVLAKGENGQSITITSYDKQPVKDGEFVVSHNYVITFSDGTEITINVPVARSIVNVEYNRTEGNKDIYVITYSDGSTSEFTVTNGTDGHSPVITIENGEWCIDGTPTGIKALGKDGKGIKSINKTTDGLVDTYTIIYTDDTEFKFTVTNGRGIVSISLTSTSADGLVDTYTITYNDGTTSTFTVTNGANGINGIQGEKGDDGHTPVITIQNGKWHIDGVDTGMQAQGVKGETGNGISDISKTGIDGLVDTYTITYTDGTKTTFTVTNGAQGAQGIQGIQGVPGKDGHTPVITIGENGNWFIDGADTGVKAEAIKGETGAPGADGEDGDTPYIGENGNWWIDGVDTGVKAEGKDGNDNNKIIILCIGIAALCIITTIVAVATKKFRRPWWILC